MLLRLPRLAGFPMLEDVPKKIGKYEIVEEAGRGSMGVVYAANDPFSHRTVAIKLAHKHFADPSTDEGERFRKLFFNEAHAAGDLDHPNVLNIFDADVDGDLCYLVMEYVHGAQTQEVFCKPKSMLPLREVVGIVYKVAPSAGLRPPSGRHVTATFWLAIYFAPRIGMSRLPTLASP